MKRRGRSDGANGRSPCGERGLKCKVPDGYATIKRRSPCGERGLKSLSSRLRHNQGNCRSPCGERGLKLQHLRPYNYNQLGRSPCGERGLKYCLPMLTTR